MTGSNAVKNNAKVSPVLFTTVLVIAFVLFSLNLRGPITAIPPLVQQIHDVLGISLVEAGLLTSIPIICFGVLSPLASWVISRIGMNISIIVMLIMTIVGTLFRPYTGTIGMMGGTFVIGAALAMGNILGLLIIGYFFPRQSSLMTGVFTSAFNVGGMLFSSISVPIASFMGWQFSLASWVWLPVMTLLMWFLVMSLNKSDTSEEYTTDSPHNEAVVKPPSVLRNKTAWILVIAMSAHLVVYFSLTAWIASYMMDVTGMSAQKAGLIAGVYQAASVIGAISFPAIERRLSMEKLLIIIGLLWFTIPLMMLSIPHQWAVWSIVGGANNGMAFVTVLVLVIKRSQSIEENRQMSSMVQGIGFTIAAAGPVGIGYLHHATEGWIAPMIVLMCFALIVSLAGVIACASTKKDKVDIELR